MVETLPRLQLQFLRVLLQVFRGLENKDTFHQAREGQLLHINI